MTTAIVAVTFDEMSRLADAVAASGLFGMKTPAQALALMAIAQAEGQHPALAARDYHVVQGRPVLKADAMLARFQAAGGRMEMTDYTDDRVCAKFTHPQGGSVVIEWTRERAKQAGIGGKDVWKQYPRQMLRARVISEGVRTVFPGAVVGMMTPEEAVDTPEMVERDVTPEKPKTGIAALQARVAEIAHHEPPKSPEPIVIEPERPTLTLDGTPPQMVTFAEVADAINGAVKAKDTDALLAAVDLIRSLPDEEQRAQLDVEARAAWKLIKKPAAKPHPGPADAAAYEAATRG